MTAREFKIVMEAGLATEEKPTETLTVTKTAEETYFNICWHKLGANSPTF